MWIKIMSNAPHVPILTHDMISNVILLNLLLVTQFIFVLNILAHFQIQSRKNRQKVATKGHVGIDGDSSKNSFPSFRVSMCPLHFTNV